MPRAGPKPEDLDFEIHVDPSCVSTPAHEAAEPEVMDDGDSNIINNDVPAEPVAEEVPDVEAEAHEEETLAAAGEDAMTETEEKKGEEEEEEEDATAPEAASEPAAEAAAEEPVEETSEETEPATEPTEAADEKEADAEADAEAEAEAEVDDAPAEEDVVPTEDDVPAADEAANDTTQDEPDEADAKSDKDLAEQSSELAAADNAEPEEPEPESEPAPEAKEDEAPQAESEPPSEDQPQEVVEEEKEEELAAEEPEPQVEDEPKEEEPPHPEPEAEPETEVEAVAAEPEPEPEVETAATEPEPEPEAEAEEEVDQARSLQPAAEITPSALATEVEEALAMHAESDETPTPAPPADEATEDHEEPAAVREASRSSSSLRRASGHTEALIHAAAKEVLERLEAQTMETIRNRSHSRQDSTGSTNHGTELHYDVRSEGTRRESYNTESRASRRESYKTESRASRRESYNTQPRSSRRESEFRPASVHAEDAADSSSQHGDSDVFSDRSPRSSLGSFDGHVDHHKDVSNRSSKRFSHMPDDVSVSELSYYEKEEFVPTIRGTNRMPFRSPSDVRALQYSSPTPSVTGSYSPRSAKRAQMPTISRLGSPTVSGQYTTKTRKTPTRFNPKKEPAPLVLLHVTLLPLRWQWAEILEQASSDALSPEAKTLREAWHHLHDRVADTVCERGILLSHPQEDYEILEERLLEALDLPLRRRARVLECGHYIGPSNEMTAGNDSDSEEDEYDDDAAAARRRSGALVKTYWCQTCRHDIRYESLGPGKIFRIKVYASNGLMRTGAWAACWKEMERVDVEIEPIVESAVLDELERLVFAQSQQLQLVKHDPAILESTEGMDHHHPEEQQQHHRGVSDFDRGMSSMERDMRSMDRGIPALEEPPRREPSSSHLEENNLLEPSYDDDHREAHHDLASSPPPAQRGSSIRSPSPAPMPRYDESEERRLRDEERMREIYGHPPPEPHHHDEPVPEPPQPEPHHDSFSAQSPPPPAPQQQQQHQQPEPEHAQQQQPPHQYPSHNQPAGGPDAAAAYPPPRPPQAFQNAGLGELLLEAARVFMQDKKNLAIVVMGLLVLFMAVRPAPREVRDWDGQFVEHVAPVAVSELPPSSAAAAAKAAPPLMETVQAVVESVAAAEEEEAPAQVVVQATPEVEDAAENNKQEGVPAAEGTASVAGDELAGSSTSAPSTAQTSAVEEETSSPAATAQTSAVEVETNSPAPSPSPSSSSSSEEVVAPSASTPAPVHETITTRELVRIIETVTETVKAVVTETEVVRVQATSSAVPEAPVEEEAAAKVEASLEDDTAEEAPAAETALPVEEPVDEQVVDEDNHDEL
ncbi:hypothetical protein LZ32DRAFT_618829 [Colletotrichum eremochloae]|nr:hypothetical protein LZ32DRAFT_618829 [Colletotrichum eremochloae]